MQLSGSPGKPPQRIVCAAGGAPEASVEPASGVGDPDVGAVVVDVATEGAVAVEAATRAAAKRCKPIF